MTETKVEARPPIPAIMHLRAKYGKHYGCRRPAVGLFRRPTMGDRMDNSAQRRQSWWTKAKAKEEDAAYERAVRHERYRWWLDQPHGTRRPPKN